MREAFDFTGTPIILQVPGEGLRDVDVRSGASSPWLVAGVPPRRHPVGAHHRQGLLRRRPARRGFGQPRCHERRSVSWAATRRLVAVVLDVAKGTVAVAARARDRAGGASRRCSRSEWSLTTWAEIVAALAVMLGHSYSPYIGFRGGKGVATAAGALLVLTPLAGPDRARWSVVVVVRSRGMVSLGSVTVAALVPGAVLTRSTETDPLVVMFAIVAAALVVWRHRSNIVAHRTGRRSYGIVGSGRR